jgi:hypothetical protein
MSWRKIDAWSKQVPDGRTVEFLFFTLFQAEGKTTSWASAKVSGMALEPIRGLASDLTRSQIEALFEKYISAS